MLKMATAQRCECCGSRVGALFLELHCIPEIHEGDRDRNPVQHILIVCPGCHASIHARSVPRWEQRLLVVTRRRETEEKIRKVFFQKPYTAPPSPDPADLFAAAFSSGEIDLFLNGA
jgi:hypothetical protein